MFAAKEQLIKSLAEVLGDLPLDAEDLEGVLAALFAKENWTAIRRYLREVEVADKAYYRIRLDGFLPVPLNKFRGSEGGRFIENNAKQTMSGLIAANAQHVPKVTDTFRPIRRVRMTVTYGNKQRSHDKDAFDKVAKDSLKWAGLIVDDSPRWLEWEVEFVKDRKHPHAHSTLIEIWDMEARR
jgi:hypothetical protein